MASYVSVPRDLTRVKSKIIMGLTKRQLICFGAAALIGVPSYFLLRKLGNNTIAMLCMIVIMMPLFLLAMYEKNGQPFEVVVKNIVRQQFLRPKVRPYMTNNAFSMEIRRQDERKEIDALATVSTQAKEKAP